MLQQRSPRLSLCGAKERCWGHRGWRHRRGTGGSLASWKKEQGVRRLPVCLSTLKKVYCWCGRTDGRMLPGLRAWASEHAGPRKAPVQPRSPSYGSLPQPNFRSLSSPLQNELLGGPSSQRKSKRAYARHATCRVDALDRPRGGLPPPFTVVASPTHPTRNRSMPTESCTFSTRAPFAVLA